MAIICKYKFNSSLCTDYLPEFNSEFTGYTKTDVDNGDNTITRTIEHDILKPTLIRFGNTGSNITDREKGLLELIECDTSNVTSMLGMFQNCTSLTSLNLSSFVTSNLTNMDSMFFGCSSLTSLNLSNFDTSKVTNMSAMFYNCNKLTSLDLSNFNTSKVTNMNSMFNGCKLLTSLDLSNFDTIKVNNMGYMFSNCNKLTSLDLSNFNTSNVISMLGMFRTCSSLTSLDVSNFNTSKVNNMRDMFTDCTSLSSLNISNFNTSNVNNMGYMFNGCSSLTSLNLSNFNTSKVQHMFDMFAGCTSLTSLDLSNFDTTNVTNMSYMFYKTLQLQDIGMVYCTKATIEKVSSLIQHTANIYVNSVIPENCTPVEGITFIFDGDIKTLYLNSPLLEGDTIEEKDGGIYHVHRGEKVVFDGSENWENTGFGNNETLNSFYFSDTGGIPNVNTAICDKMMLKNMWDSLEEGIWIDESCVITISKSKATNIEEFKTYLSNNPITAVYQLEIPTYELIEQSNLSIPSYTSGHLDLTSAVPVEKVEFKSFEEELTYLYPNTQYTVQFVSDTAITVDITLGGTQLLAQDIVQGLNRISITTPTTLTDNKLIINGVGTNISEVVVTDTDREFMYFEGMKSVGEGNGIEIVSQNKNLIDINRFKPSTDKGTVSIDGDVITFNYKGSYPTLRHTFTQKEIDLLKGKTFKFGHGGITDTVENNRLNIRFVAIVDGVDNYYSFPSTESYTRMVTLPDNMEELEFSIVPNNTSNSNIKGVFTISNMQLLFADVENTDYVPYSINTQQLTHEPLRAVGDVKDRYVMIDGKWYIERNCKEDIVDGTEEGWTPAETTESHSKFYLDMYGIRNGAKGSLILSDKFAWGEHTTIPTYEYIRIENDLDISISNSTLSTQDVSGFKQWLQQNPLTVIYQLSTPVYEPLDYNPFETYADVTHITTNSTIPTNVIVKNHGYNMVALKENTQYTLYVNKDTTNTLTYRLGDYIEVTAPSKFTFTTPSTLTDKTLRIDGKGAKVNDLMLIEGTPTNDSIGYFDGLKSSYECEQVTDENDENYGKYKVDIKVVGKNLFDTTTYIYMTNNVILNDNSSGRLDFARNRGATQGRIIFKYMKAGTYYFSANVEKMPGNLRFELWQKDKEGNFSTFEKLYDWYRLPKIGVTITLPRNGYIGLATDYSGDNLILSNIQIEEGDTATEYEPYFESKQTVYLNSPLLKGDEIVWKDNKIQHYHKMKTIVLDGSDEIKRSSVSNTDCVRYYIKTNDIKPANTNNTNFINIHSDKFITNMSSEALHVKNIEGISSTWDKHITVSILMSKLSSQDVVGFRQWLQQNPIKVVYELETPYYEEISDYPLKLNVIANSSLSTESTIQVTNISFNIYEETLPYLYPNTKYYITFNADVDRNNIIINLGGSHTVLDCKVGFNKVEITTPSNTTNLLTFSGTGVNIDHVKVTQQDIDEYFEGMKSVGECEGNVIEITSQNNLANIATSGDTNFQVANIRAGVTYSMKCTRSDNTVRYNLRLNDGYGVKLINGTLGDFCTFTPPTNGILYFNAHGSNTITDIMLVEGIYTEDTMPQFKPYTENKKELTHEPLRGIGNVKDKYVLIDGKWYIERNYARVVLNKDNCTLLGNGGISNPKTQVYQHIPNNLGVVNSKNIISDIVPTHESAWWSDIKCITLNADGYIQFRMLPNEFPTTSQRVIYKLQTPIYEPLDYNPFETYADITHISANSLIPTNVVVKNHGYNCILKPSTKYTVALNKPNGTISAKLGGSSKVDSTNSIFTITTPSMLNDNVLRLSGSGKVRDIMILEGDKTVNTPSYFEGIESVFEQEYDTEKGKYRVTAKVIGKNLFNFDTLKFIENRERWIINPNGSLTRPSIGEYLNTRIKVEGLKPNTTYTLSVEENIRPMTTNKNMFILGFGGKVSNTSDIITYTTKYNETSTTINIYSEQAINNGTELYVKNIQIEEGSTATAYESYKENNVTFYLNEPLRGTGVAKDRIYIKDDKVIVQRNCGSVNFDGSERMQAVNINDKTIEFFLPNSINETIDNMACICNTIPYGSAGVNERTTPYKTGVYITINKNKLNTQDVDGFKHWLQQNPTKVVYTLAEPVYEEADCDLSKLVLENYENSSLIFESNIPVSANVRYSGEVPVVTQAKTLSSKVDNTTLDINENIIPYMCDIDYRIVELQLMNGDTQGEGIELLGIGDIEILGNENVLFNNREDKKHNFSYDMLKRDILSQRYSKEEYRYRLDRYLLANKISDEEYKELEGLLNNGK